MKQVAVFVVLAGSLLLASGAAAVDNVLACGTLRAFDPPTQAKNVGTATVGEKTWNLSGTPGPNNISPQATVGSEVCLTGQVAQVETGPADLLIRWSLTPNTQQTAAPSTPVVYCGIVAVNSITSGQGSGPRTLELQVTSGPGGGGRFSVRESIPLPTVGSYICGQFVQGIPLNALTALMRPGDPGYVAGPVTATITPVPSAIPIASPRPQSDPSTLGTLGLVLVGLAVLVVMGLLTARSRQSTA